MNFQFRNNVTLIGGAKCSSQILDEALTLAPILLAADGGAGRALALGHAPELVIGDMDSLEDSTIAALPGAVFHPIHEQDSTDFDKALRSIEAPLVLGVGFLGGRLDHSLASLNVLVTYSQRPCILIDDEDICFHVPKALKLNLPPASRLSLFPMAQIVAQATGLRHPVEALEMRPAGQIGTSNAVGPSGRVSLAFDRPGMVVILPRAALGVAIKALQAGP